jgi:hypothetical protein
MTAESLTSVWYVEMGCVTGLNLDRVTEGAPGPDGLPAFEDVAPRRQSEDVPRLLALTTLLA